jgi:hypothetical protein
MRNKLKSPVRIRSDSLGQDDLQGHWRSSSVSDGNLEEGDGIANGQGAVDADLLHSEVIIERYTIPMLRESMPVTVTEVQAMEVEDLETERTNDEDNNGHSLTDVPTSPSESN